MPETPTEVPADVAYLAAEDRALRTTKALIMAEAQVLTLRAELGRAEQRATDAEEQARHARGLLTRRTRTLKRRIEALTGVNGDGDETDAEGGDAEADGEAHTAHSFSD